MTEDLKVGDEVKHFEYHLIEKIIKIYPDTQECKVEVTEKGYMDKNYKYFYITPIEQWEKLEREDKKI